MLPSWAIVLQITLALMAVGQISYADSAIDLLSGFDRERIDAAYPPSDDESLGELAKLAYRLRSLDSSTLKALAGTESAPELGDAIIVDGSIETTTTLAVPSKLVEFLEFSQLVVIDVRETERMTRLIATSLPKSVQIGDRVSAIGVVVDAAQVSEGVSTPQLAVISNHIRWIPKNVSSMGQQLLSDRGFDLSLLAEVTSRNRRPLQSEDGDAFYSMIATADAIGGDSELPAPTDANPVALLSNPQDLIGQWVHMDLDSVQITRIAVTESHRQQQLGSDHYYQIDAMGDLGNVMIKVEHSDKSIPPATFQNRYPVSIVTKQLPEFLREQIRNQPGGNAIVAPIRLKIGMDGFFFRLWGYESDFMSQQGGGQQFGPLVVAARLKNQEPDSEDPIGVAIIGYGAAVVVLTGMLLIWWWQRRAWAADEVARRRRPEYQSDQIQMPQ